MEWSHHNVNAKGKKELYAALQGKMILIGLTGISLYGSISICNGGAKKLAMALKENTNLTNINLSHLEEKCNHYHHQFK